MHLTPDILVATYDYLVCTPPFNKWKLPPSDDIEFAVSAHRKEWGSYEYEYGPKNNKHRISISSYKHPNHAQVRATMAHEICHVHQRFSACRERKKESASHGHTFKRLAAQVCKAHGFDPVTF